MVALLALLACKPDAAPASTPLPANAQETADHAIRASLAVRGVRPTATELRRVAADPAQLEPLVREWITDPAFAQTVRDQHAFHLGLRTPNIGKVPPVGPLAGTDLGELAHSLDEAPLYLIADVVTKGQPYSEVLTTADTMADPRTAVVHGLAYDPSGPEWQRTPWTDGRPAAGVLADTAFNQRYMSSNTNFHRSRGAAALATFLCVDLLGTANPTLFDPVGAEDAVREDPACLGCHRTLDPVASAWWGFHPYILAPWVAEAYLDGCPEGAPCYPLPFWLDEQQDDWQDHDLPEPAWGGASVGDLAGLARAWADDPAFDQCTARRFHAWHTGRDVWDVPDEVVDELTTVLDDADGDVRELVVASVLHADLTEAPQRPLRPDELARTVERLTGFAWEGDPDAIGCFGPCYGLVDLAVSDAHGFHTMMGGVDGWDVRTAADGPSPTQVLALDWLAQEAAHHVVTTDPALPRDQRRLFTVVDPGRAASEAEVRAQVAHLHLAVLGEVAPSETELDRTVALYDTVRATEGSAAAWEATVFAMLHDPRVVLP